MRGGMPGLLVFSMATLAGIEGAFAGPVAPERVLEQCGVVAEKEERIACYDRLNPPRAPAPESAPAKVAEFGLSDEMKRRQQESERAAGRAPSTTMEARVQNVSERPHGELLLELDNGQIWAQTERRAGTLIRVGESVTISRGALGSYQLVASSGASAWVKRIQ
jgi:hypothetical protein